MPAIAIEKSYCTTREAATLLGVSIGTVQLWVESGQLQAWKTTGGHRRVIRDSVERLLRKVPPIVESITTPQQVLGVRPLRVLVVDDDTDLLRLYQAQISHWPMRLQLDCVNSAVAALMMMGRGGPDLLVTDLHMPGMDGFALLRELSPAPEMEKTRIVVVSGLDAAAIAEHGGLPAGVEQLSKPIPFDRLKSIAQDLVSQRGLHLL